MLIREELMPAIGCAKQTAGLLEAQVIRITVTLADGSVIEEES
jgi:hypothetical protein